MKITVEMLKGLGACDDQIHQFEGIFGDHAEVNFENVLLAVKQRLDIDWVVNHFFTAPGREAWEKAITNAQEAYKNDTTPAMEAYEKSTAPAWKVYSRARDHAIAWETYKKATINEQEAYEKATINEREAYEKAIAHAFNEASRLLSDEIETKQYS